MNFADQLRTYVPVEVFNDSDLKVVFRELSPTAILSGLSRSLRSGDIVKLKRGIYMFGERLRRAPVSEFTAANHVTTGSYVSFESALSYHGLIPEGVYVVTSASYARKKKIFRTPLGELSYDYIPCRPFFAGVEQVGEESRFLIANPIKALFDLIYLRRKAFASVEELEADWRISMEDLGKATQSFSYLELETLARSYKKKNTLHFFELLMRTVK